MFFFLFFLLVSIFVSLFVCFFAFWVCLFVCLFVSRSVFLVGGGGIVRHRSTPQVRITVVQWALGYREWSQSIF